MTNEIKEILEELNKFPYGKYYGLKREQVSQIKTLLDYITNLQEKIEIIKSIYESMQFSAPKNLYIFVEQLGEILKGE